MKTFPVPEDLLNRISKVLDNVVLNSKEKNLDEILEIIDELDDLKHEDEDQ